MTLCCRCWIGRYFYFPIFVFQGNVFMQGNEIFQIKCCRIKIYKSLQCYTQEGYLFSNIKLKLKERAELTTYRIYLYTGCPIGNNCSFLLIQDFEQFPKNICYIWPSLRG